MMMIEYYKQTFNNSPNYSMFKFASSSLALLCLGSDSNDLNYFISNLNFFIAVLLESGLEIL